MKEDNLTLEKLKIHERLASLETIIKDSLSQVRKDVDRHDTVIYGNGKPGLKSIVEKLVEAEEKRTWTIRAISLAVIGLIANFFKEVLFKR